MTEYTPILLSTLETGDTWTATQAQAAIFNPVAITEVDQTVLDNGLIVPGVWLPFDNSDPTALVWSHAVSGDSTTIVLPDFSEKLEYKVVFESVTFDAASSSGAVQLALRLETSGYTAAKTIQPANEAPPLDVTFSGIAKIHGPFQQMFTVPVEYSGPDVSKFPIYQTSGEAVVGARISVTNGALTGGIIRMFKRRCFY